MLSNDEFIRKYLKQLEKSSSMGSDGTHIQVMRETDDATERPQFFSILEKLQQLRGGGSED